MNDKDKTNTQRATVQAVKQFSDFLRRNKLPRIEAITAPSELNDILYDYYAAIRPQKSDQYSSQTMKCMRSALNRYFKKEKGIDIAKDTQFVKANEMFKAILVEAKCNGKAVTRHTPSITSIDLERISEYFCYDHMNNPDPRRLQQQVIFYIIYFFCRRGRENLYQMRKNTFKIVVDPDGTEYLIQDIDELDKNHGPDDHDKTNDGRMYGNNHKHFNNFSTHLDSFLKENITTSKLDLNKYKIKTAIYHMSTLFPLHSPTTQNKFYHIYFYRTEPVPYPSMEIVYQQVESRF